ncbi:hypothetical protein [Acidimangrovimonas sediminis]|uniref:hypothetical protein n=1 Tax=Acidimangrovimonas sediminis TaxID=2056283 RepID=UPI0011AF4A38|nr:hypothetical protein [Acidimangrovimonas sediminis]
MTGHGVKHACSRAIRRLRVISLRLRFHAARVGAGYCVADIPLADFKGWHDAENDRLRAIETADGKGEVKTSS